MLSRYVVSQVKHNSYFLVGLGIGLWLALATVPLEEDVVSCEDTTAAALDPGLDEFQPQREERPPGAVGPAGRTVTRPRYYSTELGMRAALLAGTHNVTEMSDKPENHIFSLQNYVIGLVLLDPRICEIHFLFLLNTIITRLGLSLFDNL